MDPWKDCLSADGVATISCIPALFGQLFSVAIAAAGVVALFFIVWGGYKFIRSGGDPKQLEAARHTIMYAIIGLIIVLSAYLILTFVSRVTGVECIKVFGFDNCASPLRYCDPDVDISSSYLGDGKYSCQCGPGTTFSDPDGEGEGLEPMCKTN